MGDSLGKVAEMMLDVAEGVPDVVLDPAAAELGEKDHRLIAESAGPLVVAQQGTAPGDVGDRTGPLMLIADGLGKEERLFVLREGVSVAALSFGQYRDTHVGHRLTPAITEALIQRDAALQGCAAQVVL